MRLRDYAFILIFSLIYRIFFVLPSLINPSRALGPLWLDTHEYWALSRSLRELAYRVNGQDWLLRPPGYPALLAALPDPRLGVALQVLLSCFVALLVARWASRRFGRRAGLLSGFLAGLSPVTALLSGLLLADVAFAFFAFLGFYFLEKRPLLAGANFGLSALVKPLGLPLALLSSLFELARRRFRAGAAVAGAALLVASGWMARNWVLYGRPILSTQTEVTVFLYWAPFTLMAEKGVEYGEALRILSDTLGHPNLLEAQYDPLLPGELSRRALAYLLRHPVAFAKAWATGSFKALWGVSRTFAGLVWPLRPVALALVLFSWLYALFTYVLAPVGFKRMGSEGWFLAVVVIFLVLALGPNGSFRFRAAAEPILALGAGVGLDRLMPNNKGGNSPGG